MYQRSSILFVRLQKPYPDRLSLYRKYRNQKPIEYTRKQEVQRLYRACLKNIQNWCTGNRDLYLDNADELRDMFKAGCKEKNPKKIEKLLEQAKTYLRDCRHPDPYIHPSAPGGTKYERNLPIPAHMCLPEAHIYWPI